jgi:hypothetical protein
MVVQLDRRVDAYLRVAVVGVKDRVGVGVIVGRELSLDVRQRDVAADAEDHAVGDLREVGVVVEHDGVEAVLRILHQKLLAQDAVRGGEAVVGAVEQCQTIAIVEV